MPDDSQFAGKEEARRALNVNGFVRASAFLLICCNFAGIPDPAAWCLGQDADESFQSNKRDWKLIEGNWASCQFGGEGEVEIRGNQIKIASGQPLSGVFWDENLKRDVQDVGAHALIRDGYELRLQARRTDGFDFFCGLTFPIADQHATLVLGGWGGAVTGLSCVDGLDASQNDTTSLQNFDDDRWYRVRVRVDHSHVTCWIDDKSVVQVSRQKHQFDLRTEMDFCEPLGIAAYECAAEYKDIMIRKLFKDELKTTAPEKAKR